MRKLLFVLACALLTAGAAVAESVQMGIATGRPSGTYFQFGQDISRLVARDQIKLDVIPSQGSIENVLQVYDRRTIQLAITQSDVLYFMAELGDDKTREVVSKIRIVMPLYVEELHVLAKPNIKTLEDLNGKRIAVGDPGSGTSVTAEIVLAVAGIEPSAVFPVGGPAAVEGLQQDKVDAIFYVAGKPVRLLQETLEPDTQFHLLPITGEKIRKVFGEPVEIPAGTYAWQNDAVDTVGVLAGIMTRDFPADSDECKQVMRVSRMIQENLAWLREKGHEKWATVDLSAPVSDENKSNCSALYQ
jgi:TRAP transporter TAXI family solute receptor